MKIDSIIIFCGGEGTRIQNLTKYCPKILIKILNKPFIDHLLKILKKNKIKKIYLLSQYRSRQIENYVKYKKSFNFFVLKDGKKKLGTGGSLKKNIKYLPEYFFLTYGDSYLDTDYSPLRKKLVNTNKSIMSICKNNKKTSKGNIMFKNNKIIRYDKKKNFNYTDYGLFLLKKKDIESIKIKKKNFDFSEYIIPLISKKKIAHFISRKKFHECGSYDGIQKIIKLLNTQNN